jgi:hypothetical protein
LGGVSDDGDQEGHADAAAGQRFVQHCDILFHVQWAATMNPWPTLNTERLI